MPASALHQNAPAFGVNRGAVDQNTVIQIASRLGAVGITTAVTACAAQLNPTSIAFDAAPGFQLNSTFLGSVGAGGRTAVVIGSKVNIQFLGIAVLRRVDGLACRQNDVSCRTESEPPVGVVDKAGNDDRIVDENIAIGPGTWRQIDAKICTVGREGDVGGLQSIGNRRPGNVTPAGRNRDIEWVDQPRADLAVGCVGGDADGVGNIYFLPRSFNEATIALLRGRCVQMARDMCRASVCEEHDFTLTVFQGLGFDDTGVVDHAVEHLVHRLRRQVHGAAIGLDQAAIGHQCVHRALVDAELEQRVAIEIEREALATREFHLAQGRSDPPLVLNLFGHHGHITTTGCGDLAKVQNRGAAVALEYKIADLKIFVGQVLGRSDQATDIDLRSVGKNNTVRIHQKHLSIGIQRPFHQ